MPGWGQKRVNQRERSSRTNLRNNCKCFLMIFVLSCGRSPSAITWVKQAFPNNCCNTTITHHEFDLASVALVTVLWVCCQQLCPGLERVLGGSSARGISQSPPPPLGQAPTAEQAGRSWSKPGWDVLVAWLKRKIIHFILGESESWYNSMFHIYSYWMAPIKTRPIPCSLGNQVPWCGVKE